MGVKYWWFIQDNDTRNVYLCSSPKRDPKEDGDDDMRMKNKQSKQPFSPVTEILDYKESTPRIKVKFQKRETDNPLSLPLGYFMWDRSDFARQLADVRGDITRFVTRFMELVNTPAHTSSATCSPDTSAKGSSTSTASSTATSSTSNAGTGSLTADPYAFPHGSPSTPLFSSTPEREKAQVPKRKRPADFSASELPPLIKKQSVSVQKSMEDKVQSAYLGFCKIDLSNLRIGTNQVRKKEDWFVNELVTEMTAHSNETYQPYSIISTSLKDRKQWKAETANGFKYEVLGGQHNFAACEIMLQRHPSRSIFASRNCEVYYGPGLSRDDKIYLGVMNNKVGSTRRKSSLKEELELVRELYLEHETDPVTFAQLLPVMLKKEIKKKELEVMTAMCKRPGDIFQQFLTIVDMHKKGQLEGQKATSTQGGDDLKLYIFRPLSGITNNGVVATVLSKVINGEIPVKDIRDQTKTANLLLEIQAAMMSYLNKQTWGDLVDAFPQHSQRDALISQFSNIKFNKKMRDIPAEIKEWCEEAKRSINRQTPTGTKIVHKSGVCHVVEMDALNLDVQELETAMDTAVPGFSLVVIDMPENWTDGNLTSVLSSTTAHNVNSNIKKWVVVVLCKVAAVAGVKRVVEAQDQYQHTAAAYYHVAKPKTAQLENSVFGMVIAHRVSPQSFTWPNGTNANFISVGMDTVWTDEQRSPVDPAQKPVEIYSQLIDAITFPQQWVLDLCCGTGTGVIAALSQNRNMVAIDNDGEMLLHLKGRWAKQKKMMDSQRAKSQESNEEESNAEESNAENSNAEDSNAEDSNAEDSNAEDSNADDSNAEDSNAEEEKEAGEDNSEGEVTEEGAGKEGKPE